MQYCDRALMNKVLAWGIQTLKAFTFYYLRHWAGTT